MTCSLHKAQTRTIDTLVVYNPRMVHMCVLGTVHTHMKHDTPVSWSSIYTYTHLRGWFAFQVRWVVTSDGSHNTNLSGHNVFDYSSTDITSNTENRETKRVLTG